MRLAVYGAVLVIALGSVLLGLDRLRLPPRTHLVASCYYG